VKTEKKWTWFLDWNEAGSFRNKGRRHSIISELYSGAQRARIGINYDTKNNLKGIWANEDISTMKQCKKGETAQAVDKIFEERHLENLLKQKSRGKSFCTLRNSKVSNFFIGNPKA
jgi:hypothetical protein